MSQKSTSPESSLMTLSVEQERDSYKEKVEHLKIMIQKYKQEIQAQKIRKEGVETVSRLLHESREENASLTKKNVALETVVRNLQSRLHLYGISDSVTPEEGDMFMPGSSKQLLDNLARENKRLRSLLQGVSASSTEQEEINRLLQVVDNKTIENEQLKKAIMEQSAKLHELENLLKANDCDKLVEIKKLRDKISSMKNECETRDILCSSLTEETNTLKQQLHDVAVHCQQLATKLEQSEKSKVKSSEEVEVEKLLEENVGLKDKVSELVKMNKRWQEYMLHKERCWQETSQSQIQPQRIEAINAALEDASRRLQKLEREKKQLEEELDERNQQLITKSSELTKLQSDVQRGHFGVHDDDHLQSDAETISALKAQIQICTEDFESERRDREKAQNRVAELETELSQYKRVRQDEVPSNHQHLFEQRHSPDVYRNYNVSSPYMEPPLAARGPSRNRYDIYNVADTIQTDSGSSSKSDKNDKEGTNIATKLQNDDSTGGNLLAKVPDLNDFNSVDSDIEVERIKSMEIEMRKVEDFTLTHCPRCDQSFELGHDDEAKEHLEKCCD